MSDFFQSNSITTFHDLTHPGPAFLTKPPRPVILIVPAHAKDLSLKTVPNLVSVLGKCSWLAEVVVCLDHAAPQHARRAKRLFEILGRRAKIVLTSGTAVQRCFQRLSKKKYGPYMPGKGSNIAAGMWFVLSRHPDAVILIHDIDIQRGVYSPHLLQCLATPLLHQSFDLDACKGYYARISTNQFRGRVTRLFIAPLLHVLEDLCGRNPLIQFLREFRYPLAGEVALSADVCSRIRISQQWGFDLRLLGELWANGFAARTGQVPLVSVHDHRHPALDAQSLYGNAPRGVAGIVLSICVALWDILAKAFASRWHGTNSRGQMPMIPVDPDYVARVLNRTIGEEGLSHRDAAYLSAILSSHPVGNVLQECSRGTIGTIVRKLVGLLRRIYPSLADCRECSRYGISLSTLWLECLPLVQLLLEWPRTTTCTLIGIAGPPGSGKTTLASLLTELLRCLESGAIANVSLDDFYLPPQARHALGYRWRAQPGTHDMSLLADFVREITQNHGSVSIPAYDKCNERRQRPYILTDVPRICILEGWFVGLSQFGYGVLAESLDGLIYLDMDINDARQARLRREAEIRASSGGHQGLTSDEAERFWQEVLAPGTQTWVCPLRSEAHLLLRLNGDHTIREAKFNARNLSSTVPWFD